MDQDFDEDENHIIADINMTPLIDIMLVLLILFMVTSSMSLESGLDIELPKIAGQTESQGGSAVIISLDEGGELSVQGKEVEREQLYDALREAMREEKTTFIILEGDEQSNLGSAIEIMDVAKSAGAKKFAVAAETEL